MSQIVKNKRALLEKLNIQLIPDFLRNVDDRKNTTNKPIRKRSDRSISIRSAPRVRTIEKDKIAMAFSKKFPVDFFLDCKPEGVEKKSIPETTQPKRIKLNSNILAKIIEKQIKQVPEIIEDNQDCETPTFKDQLDKKQKTQKQNKSIFTKDAAFIMNEFIVRPRCQSSKQISSQRRMNNQTFRIRRLR